MKNFSDTLHLSLNGPMYQSLVCYWVGILCIQYIKVNYYYYYYYYGYDDKQEEDDVIPILPIDIIITSTTTNNMKDNDDDGDSTNIMQQFVFGCCCCCCFSILLEVVLGIVMYDFIFFFVHWSLHEIPILRSLHHRHHRIINIISSNNQNHHHYYRCYYGSLEELHQNHHHQQQPQQQQRRRRYDDNTIAADAATNSPSSENGSCNYTSDGVLPHPISLPCSSCCECRDTLNHGLIDGMLQVLVNILVQQYTIGIICVGSNNIPFTNITSCLTTISFSSSSPPPPPRLPYFSLPLFGRHYPFYYSWKLIMKRKCRISRILHNIIVTWMLTESHTSSPKPYIWRRWCVGIREHYLHHHHNHHNHHHHRTIATTATVATTATATIVLNQRQKKNKIPRRRRYQQFFGYLDEWKWNKVDLSTTRVVKKHH